MNASLWILQFLLALHTLMGAVWKWSNSAEQTMPSLAAIPPGLWTALGFVEIFLAAGFLLPAASRRLRILALVAAAGVAAEMLLYCGVHLSSGAVNHGPLAYWLVVAVLCACVFYGRLRGPSSARI